MVRKLTSSDIIKVYLNDYNAKYYLRELASLLGKPHQTVKPYIESLVKEKVLIKTTRMNIVEYGLNFSNKKIYDYLIIAEKEKLIKRLERDTLLQALFDNLTPLFEKNIFVIFGSAVKKVKRGSDIDLLVIGKQNVSKCLSDFEQIYNKKIHKVQINSIRKLTSAFIVEIYKKHIILNSTEQVIRFFGGLNEQNKLV